ncbi:hypothetical protein GN956_G14719 [Arapaima gigas]
MLPTGGASQVPAATTHCSRSRLGLPAGGPFAAQTVGLNTPGCQQPGPLSSQLLSRFPGRRTKAAPIFADVPGMEK